MRTLFLLIALLLSFSLFSQNQNLSNGIAFDGEPYLVINPNNSQHIVVAWMGYKFGNLLVIKYRVSFDAGNSWSTTNNIPHVISNYTSADPSITFDNAGNIYLCFIDYVKTPTAGAVYVTKSTDGGLSWGIPIEVINANEDGTKYPIDRPFIVVDNSGGINDGNLYITTKPAPWVAPPNRAYFVSSTDGGNNWSNWKYIDDTNWLIGPNIDAPLAAHTVDANGNVHIVYPSYVPSQNLWPQFIMASSSNGGTTFSYQSVMNITSASTDSLSKKGYPFLSNPANSNHLLLAYPGFDNGDLDVYIIETFDAGANWTNPVRVNNDPIANNRMQDLIWADFDNDGDLVVTWRDRRNATDSTYETASEIYGAIRWKDSTNFSNNFSITDAIVAYDTILAEKGNDFMCVSMINDTVYAVWGDVRNTKLNIWFERIDLSSGGTFVQDLNPNQDPISIFPNPTKNKVIIDFNNNDLHQANIELLSIDGKKIMTINNLNPLQELNLSEISVGYYLLRFNNKRGNQTIKLKKTE